mmetsp:Transcript_17/g.26  ORF Transcript_17/g.26 Transcript_17/m.26 type:complete len:231 (+) Transcript_17:543-1235(+)
MDQGAQPAKRVLDIRWSCILGNTQYLMRSLAHQDPLDLPLMGGIRELAAQVLVQQRPVGVLAGLAEHLDEPARRDRAQVAGELLAVVPPPRCNPSLLLDPVVGRVPAPRRGLLSAVRRVDDRLKDKLRAVAQPVAHWSPVLERLEGPIDVVKDTAGSVAVDPRGSSDAGLESENRHCTELVAREAHGDAPLAPWHPSVPDQDGVVRRLRLHRAHFSRHIPWRLLRGWSWL